MGSLTPVEHREHRDRPKANSGASARNEKSSNVEKSVSVDKPAPVDGTVLVIDDDDSVALTVSEVLRNEGFAVESVSSGREAVELCKCREYDLILTDLHMEGGDGLSVLTEARRLAPLTISIVLTGFASIESAIAALQRGAYDYLIKPCNIEVLKHTVRRGIEHRRLMLAELKARRDLEQLNRDLERRVQKRTAELTRLNQELAEANRAKDVFLATLSHELRTPLTPVLGWTNLLRTGNLQPHEMDQALEIIERNATLQSRLVDDLLDISRIATNNLRFDPKPADLNSAVSAACETVRPAAAARGVDLDLTRFGGSLIVLGEPVRLQQIVWNLLTNAIKFNEPGGRVTVRVEAEGQNARVVVEDSGIGILPEFLPHIFDRFRQADGSPTRKHGGLGLGLAIVDALAKMHGGRVKAESDGPGRGSRFTFVIPREAHASRSREGPKPVVPLAEVQPVLVVDDSTDTLELMAAIFRQRGCKVMAARSGEEAIRLAREERPSLIVSDIGMPDMDGCDLLVELRRLPGMADIPAIAISGYAMDGDRDRALSSGFSAHLAKPVEINDLFALIRRLTTVAAKPGN
jgi:signal transduction histidine kinase